MGYYPSFALFDTPPPWPQTARRLAETLRARGVIDDFGLSEAPEEFWLAGPEINLNGWPMRPNVWALEFWDFDSERYDHEQSPSPRAVNLKRMAAHHLHDALIHQLGAWMSFASSAEDNFAGSPDQWEVAGLLQDARPDLRQVRELLRRPCFFWLVAGHSLEGMPGFHPVPGFAHVWEQDLPFFIDRQ